MFVSSCFSKDSVIFRFIHSFQACSSGLHCVERSHFLSGNVAVIVQTDTHNVDCCTFFFFTGDEGCVSCRQSTAGENLPHASDELSHRTGWMWCLKGSWAHHLLTAVQVTWPCCLSPHRRQMYEYWVNKTDRPDLSRDAFSTAVMK